MESSKEVSSVIDGDIENVIESTAPTDQISKQIESVFMNKFADELLCGHNLDSGNVAKFSNLPDTILLNIFSNFSLPQLCHIALVCKHWMWIVYDSELWKYVDLSGYSKITQSNIVQLINARLSPLLKTLDLSNREITPIIINELNENCQQLDTLVLQNCMLSSSTDNDAVTLRSTVPDKLVRLDIRNFKQGFHFIHLILEASDLSHIECFGFGSNQFCPAFSDFHLIFRRMHALRILECINCTTVDDAQVRLFAEELPCLESLVLKKCENVVGSCLPFLINKSKYLKSLNLSETRLQDIALSSTPWQESSIEELDLGFCLDLTSVGLLESIPKLASLQYLALHNVGKSKAVNEELFAKVQELQSWNRLEVLCLRFCNRISSESLPSLHNCSQLKYLSLRTCYKVSYAAIASVLKYFPNLVALECGSLRVSASDICTQWIAVFNSSAEHCHRLKNIALVKCSDVPLSKISEYKKVMRKFIVACPQLENICVLYSEQAILSLFQEVLMSLKCEVNLSSVPIRAIIPPFRHSLDTELNHQRFQTFSS